MAKIELALTEAACLFLDDILERRAKEIHRKANGMEAAGLNTDKQTAQCVLIADVRMAILDSIGG